MLVSSKQLIAFFSLVGALAGLAHSERAHAQDFGIAEVVANGSGCPDGTWRSEISADGLEVTLTFSDYWAEVDANNTLATSNCHILLKLSSTYEYAYAVDKIVIQGDARIAPGMYAEIATQSYVQGATGPRAGADANVDGPFEGTFFRSLPSAVFDWSPCGSERALNVSTRLSLRNAPDATSVSFVDLSAYNAQSGSRISVQLIARQCN